ncbi:MAG TPA: hypothetical protein VFV19_18905 [Candidatus Polarisedimenticolaceae bacterium]|nr:hypothetical protein [Candidatus Polarisedimenticolaceae bacterium]
MKSFAILATLTFAVCSSAFALPSGYAYNNNQSAPTTIDSALTALLQNAYVEPRFNDSRETASGFMILLRHNSCDGTSLNSVISSASTIIQNNGFTMASVQTINEADGVTKTIVIEVTASNVTAFTAYANSDFPACFNLSGRKSKVLQLLECCGGDWGNCDYDVGKCLSCGGEYTTGLCIPAP